MRTHRRDVGESERVERLHDVVHCELLRVEEVEELDPDRADLTELCQRAVDRSVARVGLGDFRRRKVHDVVHADAHADHAFAQALHVDRRFHVRDDHVLGRAAVLERPAERVNTCAERVARREETPDRRAEPRVVCPRALRRHVVRRFLLALDELFERRRRCIGQCRLLGLGYGWRAAAIVRARAVVRRVVIIVVVVVVAPEHEAFCVLLWRGLGARLLARAAACTRSSGTVRPSARRRRRLLLCLNREERVEDVAELFARRPLRHLLVQTRVANRHLLVHEDAALVQVPLALLDQVDLVTHTQVVGVRLIAHPAVAITSHDVRIAGSWRALRSRPGASSAAPSSGRRTCARGPSTC